MQFSSILGSGLDALYNMNQTACDDELQKKFSSISGSSLNALSSMNQTASDDELCEQFSSMLGYIIKPTKSGGSDL